jgi:hypothetical protein
MSETDFSDVEAWVYLTPAERRVFQAQFNELYRNRLDALPIAPSADPATTDPRSPTHSLSKR